MRIKKANLGFFRKNKKEVVKMKTNILKALVSGLLAVCFSATLAFAGIAIPDSEEIPRVVTGIPIVLENMSDSYIESLYGISSFTEAWTREDGVKVREVTKYTYTEDGSVEKILKYVYEDGKLIEKQEISPVVRISDPMAPILYRYQPSPQSSDSICVDDLSTTFDGVVGASKLQPGERVCLATFEARPDARNYSLRVVISNIATGVAIGVVEHNSSSVDVQWVSGKGSCKY